MSETTQLHRGAGFTLNPSAIARARAAGIDLPADDTEAQAAIAANPSLFLQVYRATFEHQPGDRCEMRIRPGPTPGRVYVGSFDAHCRPDGFEELP